MTKRCERCGKFFRPSINAKNSPVCEKCAYATLAEINAKVNSNWQKAGVERQIKQQQEDAMKAEVKAGQSRHTEDGWPIYVIGLDDAYDNKESTWVVRHLVKDGPRYERLTERELRSLKMFRDEHGNPVVDRSEGQTVSGGVGGPPVEPPQQQSLVSDEKQPIKHEVKAGQTWHDDEDGDYVIIGQSASQHDRWYVEWPESGKYLRLSTDRISENRLLKDEHGDPVEQEPEVPEEVETDIRRGSEGTIEMCVPPHNGALWYIARQGIGFSGYTCIGFRFKGFSDRIFPNPLLWTHDFGNKMKGCNLFSKESFKTLTIATHAVWKKLGD